MTRFFVANVLYGGQAASKHEATTYVPFDGIVLTDTFQLNEARANRVWLVAWGRRLEGEAGGAAGGGGVCADYGFEAADFG